MSTLAFVGLALILSAYVMLDGYDLGVGALHLFIARSERERAASFEAIGPFWSGNEVMLIVAGGVLFALFPRVYAAAFSGFYLPFVIVLWLLMGRGLAIELRSHFESDLWRGFWDVVFAICSALLALLFGIALGNVLRGVPLDAHGYFAGTFAFLLNGYALLVGLLALCAIALHGATFAAWRSSELAPRAQRCIRVLWPIVTLLYLTATVATFHVRAAQIGPVLWAAPLLTIIGLAGMQLPGNGRRFAASSIFLFGLMASAAGTLYPSVLPGFPQGSAGLDITNAATGAHALRVGMILFGSGLAGTLIYATLAARRLLRGV